MELKDCIVSRRSVRKFKDEPVSRETIEKLVELSAWSPSWKNTQVVRYVAVTDRELKNRIADECVLGFGNNAKIISRTPLLMILTYKHGISGYEKTGEPTTSKGDKWEVFDAGIAAQTFSLAAHDMGLGTVIMGIFDDKKVAEVAGLPEGQVAAALIAVGYPDIDPTAPPRKDVETLLTWK